MTVTKVDLPYEKPEPWYYLWHLISLGVIDADISAGLGSPTITDTVWDKLKTKYPSAAPHPATVALIDVGVSRNHPNLKGRIDDRSIDLVTHRYGARSNPNSAGPSYDAETSFAFFSDLDLTGLNLDLSAIVSAADAQDWFDKLVGELKSSKGVIRNLIDTDDVFGTHGTSIAGLVVGEPALTASATTANLIDKTVGITPSQSTGVIPYFGVDPLSKLISIRSSFEPDPAHFIAAFLYAWKCKADVILLPRGIPDTTQKRAMKLTAEVDDKNQIYLPKNAERANLFERFNIKIGEEELDIKSPAPIANPDLGWDVLAALLVAISKEIPIVCAAGNDGESQLIYPANLADPSNGIIAVGAVTAKGYRSGYSNYGEHLTLVAPSDDGEVYNRHQLRIDRSNPMVGLHAYMADPDKVIPYSPLSLLTTDLPGTFGYAEGADPLASVFSPLPGADDGIGGYYAPFGGTSGASALVAGVAALVARAHKMEQNSQHARLSGLDIKKKLVNASSTNRAVLSGGTTLTRDRMNADNEFDLLGHDAKFWFGAGLPDAWDAVND